jgi:hypothetical protein
METTTIEMENPVECEEQYPVEMPHPKGRTWEEFRYELEKEASETSGIDFLKVTRMLNSGELNINEMTDEMLYSPEFKYEPYPGFKPRPCRPTILPLKEQEVIRSMLDEF